VGVSPVHPTGRICSLTYEYRGPVLSTSFTNHRDMFDLRNRNHIGGRFVTNEKPKEGPELRLPKRARLQGRSQEKKMIRTAHC